MPANDTSHTPWSPERVPNLPAGVAIVTGANSGLGFELALQLARKRMTVVMACRHRHRAEQARREIISRCHDAKLTVMLLDLASQASVRQFAEGFRDRYRRLDLLINNAGIMMTPYELTEDGFEKQLATNYLGHFTLTGLLPPLLRTTPEARVVSTTSLSYKWSPLRFDDPMFREGYSRRAAYGQSKRACLVFAYELQRRLEKDGSPISSLAAHPGLADTELDRHFPGFIRPVAGLLFPSAERGARHPLYAALAEDVTGGEFIGPDGFLHIRGEPSRVSSDRNSRNPNTGTRLWSLSERLTGVSYLS